MFIFSDQLTTSRVGNLTQIILTLAIGVTIHAPLILDFVSHAFLYSLSEAK